MGRSRTLVAAVVALVVVSGLVMLQTDAASAAPLAKAECTITGTNKAEVLRGTAGDDVICGLGGDDVLIGMAGDDELRGGPGDDSLRGGDGQDQLFGGPGKAVASGGRGTDFYHSAATNDDGDWTLTNGTGSYITFQFADEICVDGGFVRPLIIPTGASRTVRVYFVRDGQCATEDSRLILDYSTASGLSGHCTFVASKLNPLALRSSCTGDLLVTSSSGSGSSELVFSLRQPR